jgi:hypothetical protein
MPLDPILSLSVALAEAPGSGAMLLGAGVSVDAGVPTGWEVFQDLLRRLYRMENESADSPDDQQLDAWLKASAREDLGYSSVLDLLTPDPATRRDLLAGYFENVLPGQAHERLAALAVVGVVRVFVTTNFDRLLERALEAAGVDPVVVVSDDATLAAAPRREHSKVFVVKAHGDYLQETMRNTPSELAALEPELTAELQAISNNYALAVLGWSGADPGLADILKARRSRYGAWWLSLTEPPAEPGRSVAETIGARVIVREGAADFLADLAGRLAVYAEHESGNDPGTVHDEILGLVRRGDTIGLDEVLRRERYAFQSVIESVTADHFNKHVDEETVRDAWSRLGPATERRLASLIPLALHEPKLFAAELRGDTSWATGSLLRGGSMTWQQIWRLSFWTIGLALGGLLTRLERYESIGVLLAATWIDHNQRVEPYVDRPYDAGQAIADMFGPAPPEGSNWRFSAWNWLLADLKKRGWLTGRYPDWLSRAQEPEASIMAFDLLRYIAAGVSGIGNGIPLWAFNAGVAKAFTTRLHLDSDLRSQAAQAVGLDVSDFPERGAEILTTAQGWDHSSFGIQETANALRTGSPY